EFIESLRMEWAQSRARVQRWAEEDKLLVEEMHRVLVYFAWQALWWHENSLKRT
ncbi:hypothetical protein C8Q73DRAFT_628610, partial [Cubamyces lactineus]